MSYLAGQLTGKGEGESVVFLNDIVAQLWPNINISVGQMIKDIAGPMLKTMLPGPLANLQFVKVELGNVPIKFSHALVTKTERDGIKLDLNLDWEGNCDIELDGSMVPALGVEGLKLRGRLSILLCPLTNVIPLIGAAQVAFINPPDIKLDFTGAANLADMSVVDTAVRQLILSIINGMATLPNRYLVKLDAKNDYFKTCLYPLGIVRVTVDKAWGFAEESKSATSKFFSKLTRASPDTYANVAVGAEETWKTSTKSNTTKPHWKETHDFVVTDFDQNLTINLLDEDVGGDDEIGLAVTAVKDILTAGGHQELAIMKEDKDTGGKVSVACQFFAFEAGSSSFSASDHKGDGKICGLVTVLIASAAGIKGQREELKPSVVVEWGSKHHFQTGIQEDAPGTDINNPAFDQSFRIPVTTDMIGSSGANAFKLALMNGEKEVGSVDVPYADVLKAPDMVLQNKFDVGGGTTVRASICMRGIKPGNMKDTAALPQRPNQSTGNMKHTGSLPQRPKQ